MGCTACGAEVRRGDSYCRKCGRPLDGRLLPVPLAARLLARRPAPVPPIVLGGMAALVAGRAARWALREIAAAVVRRAAARPAQAPTIIRPEFGALPPGSRVVTRVWWHTEIYVPPVPLQKSRRRWPFG